MGFASPGANHQEASWRRLHRRPPARYARPVNAPLLVCAAIEEELARLLPRLTRGQGRWTGALGDRPIVAAPIGIGPVDAALGAAAALAERPAAAIFVGTCGAFPGTRLAIGAAVVASRSVLTASDAAAGLSYVPRPAQRIARGDEALCAELSAEGAPLVGAATVVAITRDAERAEALRRLSGCEVEHLEAHAFLRAAEVAGIPAACVLGVSNEVGPLAHEQWLAHAAAASEAAVGVLLRWLDR